MPANTYGRQVVEALVNKSGGAVAAGDVVIIDTANDGAFTTTTTAAYTGLVGVAQETIASNATGRILTAGYAALVNVNASVTRGQFGKTHTVAKQATGASTRAAGTFAQWLTGGTTPTAHVFGFPDGTASSSGASATDPLSFGYPMTADPGYATSAGAAVGSGVCRYMRVIGGGAITKVGLHLTASGGNIAIAHYSASGTGRTAVPGTRVATTGAIASPGTGYQEVSLSTTLVAGDFLAISADSNTPTLLVAGGFTSAASAIAKGRNFAQGSSGHPCPSPVGTLDAGNPVTFILIGVP